MNSADCRTKYLQAFLYTSTRPVFAKHLAENLNISGLALSGVEEKLLTLGALLNTGHTKLFEATLKAIDFDGLDPELSSALAINIFEVFEDVLKGDHGRMIAPYLLQLVTRICPDKLRSHEVPYASAVPTGLLQFDYSGKISPNVTGVVFFREFMYGPGSRKHEFGYRIQAALASQGWDIALMPIVEIRDYSSSVVKDAVFIDLAGFYGVRRAEVIETIAGLRRHFRKIILIEPDPWTGNSNELIYTVSDLIDYIWGFTSEWEVAYDPLFRDRAIFFPNVGGFDNLLQHDLPILNWDLSTFSFTGSLQGYNINRIYWILEIISRELPVKINISNPSIDDGLDRESSLFLYAHKLASTSVSINFTSRPDGSRILTGRAMEVISLNRLLLQECCPAMNNYFINREHFFEFHDIDELAALIDSLLSNPATVKQICTQGHHFYQSRYSSRRMVEHIQTLL